MIRWWEWLRSPDVAEWKGRHNVTWDACSKKVCGAERVRWEALVGTETMDLKGAQNSTGATSQVVDLAEAFEKVQLTVVWRWAMYFSFPQRVSSVLCVILRARRAMVENSVSCPMTTITAISLGSKGSVLLLRIAMQDAMRSVFSVLPVVWIRVYDDETRNLNELLKNDMGRVLLGAFCL